jgi:hypothetical protein
MTFTDAEARLLGAMLTGECHYNLFIEGDGGDYAEYWARRCGVTDADAFMRKLAKITLFRR